MITCLLEGMLKSSHIHVNYNKIREVTQEKDQSPALFLSQLTEAVKEKYTNLLYSVCPLQHEAPGR